jgi:hypothetical protein
MSSTTQGAGGGVGSAVRDLGLCRTVMMIISFGDNRVAAGRHSRKLTDPPPVSMLWSISTRRRPISHGGFLSALGNSWCS